jgi:hypothetical protein
MFRAFLCPSSGAYQLLLPRSNGKPEGAIAVDKLLMLGMRMPETCWAFFKRQAIKLRDWCIWLVDLFEYMMMYGLTNPKCIFSCYGISLSLHNPATGSQPNSVQSGLLVSLQRIVTEMTTCSRQTRSHPCLEDMQRCVTNCAQNTVCTAAHYTFGQVRLFSKGRFN